MKGLLNMRVNFNARIKPIRPLNKGFTLCRCFVLALGKNANKSNITRETVEAALPSLFNIPIVGHIFHDKDGKSHMGGHDMVLTKEKGGEFKFEVLTVPFGVVPESCNPCYEELSENNETKTYLVCDVILWTARYPELEQTIYSKDTWFAQSMEIEVAELALNKEDESIIDINKFCFSGLCLLGKSEQEEFNYGPCFPSAKVEPYSFSNDFMGEFAKMKTELAECFANKLDDMKRKQLDELLAWKAQFEADERLRKFAKILNDFSELKDDEAFKKLEKGLMNFSSESDVIKECFAIRGKRASSNSELKIPVATDEKVKDSKYGEFFDTYLQGER